MIPEVWEDMDSDERHAYRLSEAFKTFILRRGGEISWNMFLPEIDRVRLPHPDSGPRAADRLRQSKHWETFVGTWERFKGCAVFNAYELVQAVYRSVGKGEKVYPGRLNTKGAERAYSEHIEAIKEVHYQQSDDHHRVEEWLVGTHRVIKNRIGDLTPEKLWDFFNRPKDGFALAEGMVLAVHNMLSFYYLSMSKAFQEAWASADQDIRDEIALDEQKWGILRASVKINPKLYSWAKRLFGDDIV